jgi:hypothetical protein
LISDDGYKIYHDKINTNKEKSMKLPIKKTNIILLIFSFLILPCFLNAQQSELTDEEKAKANNPLASTKAFNVQYYYRPYLNLTEGGMANTTWFRFAVPTGRILWRVSFPLEVRHVNNSTTNFGKSGIGDLDMFAAYLAVMKPKLTIGIGPAASFDTASDDALGTGKTTLGAAAVVFYMPNPQLQVGGLVIWRTDIGGDENRGDVNVLALQPIYLWQLGKGLYFRGAPIWVFDLENDYHHVPMGLGIGKVIKIKKVVYNFFIEAQPSVLVKGPGQPALQVYMSLNMQF